MSSSSMKGALGRTVVALDTAEEIGDVKAFVIDQHVTHVERIQVDGRNKKAMFVEWGAVESFGPDALMIRAADAPSRSNDDREVARGDIDIIGARVLDTAGFEQGVVADVDFDPVDGSINAVVTDAGASIDAANVHSLGTYALVVDAS